MKQLSRIILIAVTVNISLTGVAFAKANTDKKVSTAAATQLVNKVLNGQGTIQQNFPAVDGLIGFVVQSSQGNNGIIYADAKGQYMFVGSIINGQGQDLTQLYTNQYINSKIAGPAYQDAGSTGYFSDGSDDAPHKAYIIIDPNCIFCHVLYQQMQPLIANGQVQVRWIPVAFRDPSSPGKAAALLNAGSDAAADKLLQQNEAGFNDESESGGLTPLAPNPNDANVTAAFTKVTQNTAYFSKYGFQGTPTILYKQKDGKVMMVPGMPRGQAFQDMINNMGASW
jgi:thiol:disulfide interchange protein DsbG